MKHIEFLKKCQNHWTLLCSAAPQGGFSLWATSSDEKERGPTDRDGWKQFADPDPGSGAFLTPGSGMGKISGSESGIRDEQPWSHFLELRNNFWVKILKLSGIRDGEKFRSGINIPDPQHWTSDTFLWKSIITGPSSSLPSATAPSQVNNCPSVPAGSSMACRMAGPSSNLGSAPQGGFSLWARSNEEKERGLGEWKWMNVGTVWMWL
jgi:hypothetical protein